MVRSSADAQRVNDDGHGGQRSRTAIVMDELLSRGPVIGQWRRPDATNAAGPWVTIRHVLGTTSPSILEGHLTWLVAATGGHHHRSPALVLVDDQARILIRALDERDEDAVIARALEQPWAVDTVPDADEAVITYASALRRATGGQPDDSPYVALARSAALVAAEILGRRDSSTARSRSA